MTVIVNHNVAGLENRSTRQDDQSFVPCPLAPVGRLEVLHAGALAAPRLSLLWRHIERLEHFGQFEPFPQTVGKPSGTVRLSFLHSCRVVRRWPEFGDPWRGILGYLNLASIQASDVDELLANGVSFTHEIHPFLFAQA